MTNQFALKRILLYMLNYQKYLTVKNSVDCVEFKV